MAEEAIVSLNDVDVYARDVDTLRPGQWLNDPIISYGLRRLRLRLLMLQKQGAGGDARAATDEDTPTFTVPVSTMTTTPTTFFSEATSSVPVASLNLVGSLEYSREDMETSDHTFLMSPTSTMCLRAQCHDEEDHENVELGLSIRTREWVITIISDNSDQSSATSHWSLFVCNIKSSEAFHFDSHDPYNFAAANHTKSKFEVHIKRKFKRIVNIPCPQQTNGYDCGVFSLVFADRIFNALVSGSATSMPTSTGPDSLVEAFTRVVSSVRSDEVSAYRKTLFDELDALKRILANKK